MDFQLLVIAIFLLTFFSMKVMALIALPNAGIKFLYRTPVFAPFSEKRSQRKNQASVKRLKRRFFLVSLANILGIEFYQILFASFNFSQIAKAWLCAPYLYLFTNLVGISAQCIGLLTKEIPADLHNRPYLSGSVSEFWGKRWNIWVGDWLALISRKISPKSGITRIFFAFLLSGLFHEAIISLPYYLHTGKSFFGYMILFFLIQFVFVSFDKKFLASSGPNLRRFFLWPALFAPMQLFNNPAVLAFFGF